MEIYTEVVRWGGGGVGGGGGVWGVGVGGVGGAVSGLGVVRWLAARGSKVHGVEGPSTDIMDTKLFPSHRACRDAGLTHYEWLVNLTALIGAGEFMFYGVPLLLDQGTGSPVRAFAVLED